MEKATRQHTKDHNRSLVLSTIFAHNQISRAEIARITKLTRTTVSSIVSDIITEGLVEEVGIGTSYGGKNPILLSLVEDSRWMIGLDLSHNQFRGAIVNLRGVIRDVITMPVEGHDGNEALELLYQIVDQLMQKVTRPLLGIGVGTPGLVNTQKGIILNAVNLNWQNLPLTHILEERYNTPVYVLNDSQAAAIGEKTFGEGYSPEESMVLINIRHGIGAGIVINGSLYQGDGGCAGEIGHIVVVKEGGELCRCGNHGCLETVASAQALIKKARAGIQAFSESSLPHEPKQIDLPEIKAAFDAGNPFAQELVLDTAKFIGMVISNIVSILNIHKIVLVGDMTCFGEKWLNAIYDSAQKYSLQKPMFNTRIEIGQSGENSIILGATAILATDYTLLFSQS
ncbi:MAG: ROK family transcriptional regulator [Chloroflexi bacterium]|nr:ROK family transcriptional regulator [Chloroflexota bacterium]